MSDPSKYAENQILSATVKRYAMAAEFFAKMLIKATAATTGISEFSGVMGAFSMQSGAWHGAYQAWRVATVSAPAATRAFEDKLASLTHSDADADSPLEIWDATIRTQIPTMGPVYLSIFPNGRETFTRGSYDERLAALETMSTKLSQQVAKPVLVALGITVLGFYTTALALRDAQTLAKATLETTRIQLETRRVAFAIAAFKVLGCGIMVWGETPELVDTLFDVDILRSPAQDVPDAPVDTTWTPATRTLSTTVLPARASRLEAWRIAPGGMPEQLHTGDFGATSVLIPATITWVSGGVYQLWLVAVNSTGASESGPVQSWTAP